MDWIQISIETPGEVDALEEILLSLGAASVSLANASETPLFEPAPGETPLWERNWVTGLFPASTDPATVIFSVQAKLRLPEPPRYRIESLADRDWIRACLADLKPMRFGRRLWVCPSGHEVKEPDALVVHLDPGLAFGTGTHPSTALCLRALDGEMLKGKSVIDYGCGSGILALAAARLDATLVRAVDIDPQALLATNENAGRNALSDRITTCLPAALDAAPCDLLVANILAGPLLNLAPDFARRVRPAGRLLLAGLLKDNAAEIRAAYAPWFALPEATHEEEWLCLAGYRHAT